MIPVRDTPTDAFAVSGSSPPSDRLAELRRRALAGWISVLADDEVLALVIGHGADAIERARDLLGHDGLLGVARMSSRELQHHARGSAGSTRLLATFDLLRRLALARLHQRPRLDRPEAIAEAMAPISAGLVHEQLWALPLDPHCRLMGQPRVVSVGDADGTDAGARAFFRVALAAGATSVIAVHNHPAGDPAPSAADRLATTSLVQAGRTIGLTVNDHIILGDGGRFCSLRRCLPDLFR